MQRALPGAVAGQRDRPVRPTKNTGLFLQDTWNVNDQLTLTYGVRYDRNDVDGRPLANAAAAQPLVAGNAATGARQSGGFGLDNTQHHRRHRPGPATLRLQLPLRQVAASDPGARRLRPVPGRRSDRVDVEPVLEPGRGHRARSAARLPATTRCPTTGGLISLDPDAQPTVAGAIPAANVDFLDPTFRQPSIWKTNLAFDTELPWYGLVFGAEALYTKNKNGIYYENLNLGAATRTGTDGRQLFWNAAGLNPAQLQCGEQLCQYHQRPRRSRLVR